MIPVFVSVTLIILSRLAMKYHSDGGSDQKCLLKVITSILVISVAVRGAGV